MPYSHRELEDTIRAAEEHQQTHDLGPVGGRPSEEEQQALPRARRHLYPSVFTESKPTEADHRRPRDDMVERADEHAAVLSGGVGGIGVEVVGGVPRRRPLDEAAKVMVQVPREEAHGDARDEDGDEEDQSHRGVLHVRPLRELRPPRALEAVFVPALVARVVRRVVVRRPPPRVETLHVDARHGARAEARREEPPRAAVRGIAVEADAARVGVGGGGRGGGGGGGGGGSRRGDVLALSGRSSSGTGGSSTSRPARARTGAPVGVADDEKHGAVALQALGQARPCVEAKRLPHVDERLARGRERRLIMDSLLQ